MPLRVLILSRYHRAGASSRIRIYQYLKFLEERGFRITVSPFFWESYQQDLYDGRRPALTSLFRAYWRRLEILRSAKEYDLVWIEYEVLPWLPAFCERWLDAQGVPFLVDYDDAIFHRYDQSSHFWIRYLLGGKVDFIMRKAKVVTVGNNYLRNRATNAGATCVEVLPSAVDLKYYRPRTTEPSTGKLVIGWIGSPSTAHYLNLVRDALAEICRLRPVKLIFVGTGPFDFAGLPVETCSWSETTELKLLQSFDIGIMPLPDEPWERGKSGFKLIQYMACALPVVATPVGVNQELVQPDVNGFRAETLDEWVTALLRLIDDAELRRIFGQAGRKLVEERYCTEKIAPNLAELLQAAASEDSVCAV